MAEKKTMKKMKGIPVFHVLKRKNEYKEEDLKSAVENANKQIKFAEKSIPIFAKHPKKGEKVPVLDYAREFELAEGEMLAPGKNKKMEIKKLPTIYAGMPDDLKNRIKNGEFPDRSIGFAWKRESKESEPVPVITHIALLPEGHIPEIKFADLKEEAFEFEEDGIEIFTETFEGEFNEGDKKEGEEDKTGGEPNKSEGEVKKDGEGDKGGEITIGMLFDLVKQQNADMMELMKGMAGIPPKVETPPEVDPDPNKTDPNNINKDGGGDNLSMPLENFEALINEENFEAKLVTDTHKTSLSREKLISTYKAYASGDVDKMIAELIDIAPSENFSANLNDDSNDFNDVIYESDEEFEAGVTKRNAAWKKVDETGKSPHDIYEKNFPKLTEDERYKKYFKIK